MLLAEDANNFSMYGGLFGGLAVAIAALFTGLGSLLTIWYRGSGQVRANALLEYKALYDTSRTEVHGLRNDLQAAMTRLMEARLVWEQETAKVLAQHHQEMTELKTEHTTQVVQLNDEVFKLHGENIRCVQDAGNLRTEIRVLQVQMAQQQHVTKTVVSPEGPNNVPSRDVLRLISNVIARDGKPFMTAAKTFYDGTTDHGPEFAVAFVKRFDVELDTVRRMLEMPDVSISRVLGEVLKIVRGDAITATEG